MESRAMPRLLTRGSGRTNGGSDFHDIEKPLLCGLSGAGTPFNDHGVKSRLMERRATRYASSNVECHSPVVELGLSRRQKAWQFLNRSLLEEGPCQVWAKRFEYFCASLILLNVSADVLDSVPTFPFTEDQSPSFRVLERFSCAVFTCEYLLRVWSCVESEELGVGSSCAKRLRYMTRALPLLDLLVVVVFYIDIFLSSDESRGFQSLRVIRTLRLLALLKMERQTKSFATVFRVFSRRRYDLFATLFLALVLLIIASTAMYYVETEAQPDKFSSIPATMWWSVTAMTTVGYGDIFPITVPGKLLGSFVAFLGIGLFALPSGIISSGFVEILEEQRQADTEDLAEILDEDKASVDQLQANVLQLRQQLDAMQDRLKRSEADALEARHDQKQVLELLRELVPPKASGEQEQPPKASGEQEQPPKASGEQ